MNPGYEEDIQNLPFVGPSGDLLHSSYIDGISLRNRASILLMNTARCYSKTPGTKNLRTCFERHSLPELLGVLQCLTSSSSPSGASPPPPSSSSSKTSSSPAPTVSSAAPTSTQPRTPTPASSPSPLSSTSASSALSPPSPSATIRAYVILLGANAVSTFMKSALSEKITLQQALTKHQLRTVLLPSSTAPKGLECTILSTYHPAYVLRSPNAIHAVRDHLQLLSNSLSGLSLSPSSPSIIPPLHPSTYLRGISLGSDNEAPSDLSGRL